MRRDSAGDPKTGYVGSPPPVSRVLEYETLLRIETLLRRLVEIFEHDPAEDLEGEGMEDGLVPMSILAMGDREES